MPDSPHIRRPGWILGAVLIGTGLFMLRYGYTFGFSDQDEFLPLVARILDKDLFQADWFVSMQFEGFSIRWPMALLVALPSTLLPVWSVVFLLHVATALISASAVARLTHRIFHSRMATLAATVAAFAITTRWNPGGNDILHGMLVPSSVAWCLILTAVERLHGRRFFAAGSLLGAATLFHPLLGLQAGGVLLLIALTVPDLSVKHRVQLAAPFLVVLVPVAALLSSVGTGSAEATTILTSLRAPHHYLPGSFALRAWITFGGLVLAAGALLAQDRSYRYVFQAAAVHRNLPGMTRWDRSILLRLILIPTGLLLISLFLTTWPLQWPLAIRMQPWALSPLVRVVATLTVVGFVANEVLSRWGGPAREFMSGSLRDQRMPYRADWMLPFLGILVIVTGLYANQESILDTSNPERDLHAWAQENSARDAVFVVPPSMTGFQFGSSRAQYVSFKSFPFAAEPSLVWWQRLQEIAPVDRTEPGGTALLARLDSSYAHAGLDDMRSFVATHDVDYIVRPQPDPAGWQEKETAEWCSERWCVFWAGRILTQPVRPARP